MFLVYVHVCLVCSFTTILVILYVVFTCTHVYTFVFVQNWKGEGVLLS